jgi:hypothetical protein
MGLKSFSIHVVLGVIGSMLLSTAAVAQLSASYAAGASNKPPVECAPVAMAALSDAGFTNVQAADVSAPHQGAVGGAPPNFVGVIICTEHRDLVAVVAGTADPTSQLNSVVQSLNRRGGTSSPTPSLAQFTNSFTMSISFNQCLQRASAALREDGFEIKVNQDSVMGQRGEIVATMICASRVAFLAVSGPLSDPASSAVKIRADTISEHFKQSR